MAVTLEALYQTANSATGKVVTMDVYKPDHTKDDVQSAEMTEIGTTGRYHGAFVADGANWSVQISDNAGGKQSKIWDAVAYGVKEVAVLVADVKTAVDAIATAIGTLQDSVGGVSDAVTAVGGDVTGIKTVTDTLAAALSSIADGVAAQANPPVMG